MFYLYFWHTLLFWLAEPRGQVLVLHPRAHTTRFPSSSDRGQPGDEQGDDQRVLAWEGRRGRARIQVEMIDGKDRDKLATCSRSERKQTDPVNDP